MSWLLGFLALISFAALSQGQAIGYCARPLLHPFATYTPEPTGQYQTYPVGTVLTFTCRPGYRNVGDDTLRCEGVYWRPFGLRARAPRCVSVGAVMGMGQGPAVPATPVVPVVPVAPRQPDPVVTSVLPVFCATTCTGRNQRCILYRGQTICACTANYFKVGAECIPRSSIQDALASDCARIPCPANSRCGRYNILACICNPGYFLFGRSCVAWPVEVPVVVTCTLPPGTARLQSLPPGRTVFAVGDEVTFACTDGNYALSGDRRGVCTTSGAFSIAIPVCLLRVTAPPVVVCRGPRIPANTIPLAVGQVAWAVNQRVTFQCRAGYTRVGLGSTLCLASGIFEVHDTECVAIPVQRAICPPPRAPVNGRINEVRVEWRAGDVVTYTCSPGFALIGSGRAECQSNGVFSSNPPTCGAPALCPAPFVPARGFIDKDQTALLPAGETVTYNCLEGSTLSGDNVLTCRADGTYDKPFPYCQMPFGSDEPQPVPVTCARPVLPANAFIVGTQTIFTPGQVAQIACASGFDLRGSNAIVCSSAGTFAVITSVCEPRPAAVRCVNPPAINNGFAVTSGITIWNVGEAVTYQCLQNFILEGSGRSVCLSNGVFSNPGSTCRAAVVVTCARPTPPANSVIRQAGQATWAVGAAITFDCLSGYTQEGSGSAVCLASGSFSTITTVCRAVVAVTCARPTPPANSVIRQAGQATWAIGAVITFDCLSGFTQEGSGSAVCLASGSFSTITTVCRAISPTCTNVQVPANAVIVPADRVFWQIGDAIIFQCNAGYSFRDAVAAQICGDNGAILGPLPICDPAAPPPPGTTAPATVPPRATCTNIQVPANAVVIPAGRTVWQAGDLIVFECNLGYVFQTVGSQLCGSDGTIIGNLPVCEGSPPPPPPTLTTTIAPPPPTCRPPLPANAQFVPPEVTEFVINTPFTVACNPGYNLIGLDRNVCVDETTLAVDEPRCIPIVPVVIVEQPGPGLGFCQPANPANGFVTPRNQTYYETGDPFTYECDPGYTRSGTFSNLCTDDSGSLLVPSPTCEPSV